MAAYDYDLARAIRNKITSSVPEYVYATAWTGGTIELNNTHNRVLCIVEFHQNIVIIFEEQNRARYNKETHIEYADPNFIEELMSGIYKILRTDTTYKDTSK